MSSTVTVVLNNRDLVTWPREMVRHIERLRGLERILIVDNASTYSPLLDFYAKCPHEIVYLPNLGHTAPWSPVVQEKITTDWYVVSDADLEIGDLPSDCLQHLMRCLAAFPRAGKIGLGLKIDGVPQESPYYNHVNTYERRFWELPLLGSLVRAAPVDTTFAIYHKSLLNRYAVCGARTDMPYAAHHPAWSIIDPDEEFQYYLDHASASSSYKAFVASTRKLSPGTPPGPTSTGSSGY